MIEAIQPTTSASGCEVPMKGFGSVSPLGCGFALAMQAFAKMWVAMETAGTQEAELSAGQNEQAVALSNAKDTIASALQKQIIADQLYMAQHLDPTAKGDPNPWTQMQRTIMALQVEEDQVKSQIQQDIGTEQANATDASNKFGTALSNMNTLFDVSKESLNKILGTLTTFITMFSNH